MRQHERHVTGDRVFINVMTTDSDAERFAQWVQQNDWQVVAIDVEATGLNQYAPDWELRMVQFGTPYEAWVIPAEFPTSIDYGLQMFKDTVAHNRPYDATALKVAGFDHRLWEGTDTMLMSHLLDSRSPRDGGIGHGLKALSTHYVDSEAADSEAALKQWAKDNKVKMGDRFRLAPIEELEVYAGMDVILTRRLMDILKQLLEQAGDELLDFELHTQRTCQSMADLGFRLDIPYAHALRDYFMEEELQLRERIAEHDIENPNSTAQIRRALEDRGVELDVRTPSGAASVAKEVLSHVDHPLAKLITEFRHVSKFRVSYVDRSLELVHEGRIHPNIRSLQARTARMAISDPPLQQLPATDALIRRMFIADPGQAICAADFSQVELRVLAALADETAMIEAIAEGVDLHTNTADRVGIDRKIAKMTNFLTVYGGGKRALAVQADISEMEADAALKGFKRAFPRITTYGNRLQERSGYGKRPVVTASGRRLRLDRDRTYAAINYVVQSTARDVLANAMHDVEAEFPGIMLLPVHDEIVFQAPIELAPQRAQEVARIMETDFLGVFLASEGEVFGPSWGHGYTQYGDIPLSLKEWF